MFYTSMGRSLQAQPMTRESSQTELAGGACIQRLLPQGLRVRRLVLPVLEREQRQIGFALRSLPTLSAATPERSSSSSLPPSFAPGRCATIFCDGGAADRGTPVMFGAAVSRPAVDRKG